MRFDSKASRQRLRKTLSAALLLSLVTACADAPADSAANWSGTIDTLTNGAVLVQNTSEGIWQPDEAWTIEKDLRLGSVDEAGPELFGPVYKLALAVDPLGRMYVLDNQSKEVRVFDADGSHVRTIGREGAGPGEFSDPVGIGWGPDDHLWVVDPGNARYSVFDTAGNYIDAYPRDITYRQSPWPGSFDEAGRVLDIGIEYGGGRDYAMVLIRGDARGQPVDTFPLPSYDGGVFELLNSYGLVSRSTSIPFGGRLDWKVGPEGHILSAITDDYRIAEQTLTGDTLTIIEREYDPVPVQAVEKEEALERLADFRAAGGNVDPSRIPDTKPPMYGFFVDGDHFLWVVPHQPENPETMQFDLFDPDGRYLGQVASPPILSNPQPPIVVGDKIYGFARDELGVSYLVRHRIIR